MRRKGIVAINPDQEWMAREDMQTLRRAEEIRKDPKRLEAATNQAQKHIEELSRVKSIKPVTPRKATPRRRTMPRKP